MCFPTIELWIGKPKIFSLTTQGSMRNCGNKHVSQKFSKLNKLKPDGQGTTRLVSLISLPDMTT